jgi:beta-glucosidase
VDQSLTTDVFSVVPGLVREGKLPQVIVDRATAGVLRAKFASRLFDEGMYVDSTVSAKSLDPADHRALAKEVALQGITLLKNQDGLLPLRNLQSVHDPRKQTIAVIGPLGDSAGAMIGQKGYAMPGAHVVTVAKAVSAAGHTVLTAQGAAVNDADESKITPAVRLIEQADVVLLVLGEDATVCMESHDRVDLELPGGQLPLLHAAQVAAGKRKIPLVLILIHARPLTFGTGRFNVWGGGPNALLTRTDAVLSAYNPGEEGGNALWSIITGQRSPEGKLTVSWPQSAAHLHSTHSPWMTLRQGSGSEEPYSFATQWAMFPMGHGLSFTSFVYSNLTIVPTLLTSLSDSGRNDTIGDVVSYTASVAVTNNGTMAGAETVLFLHSLWVSQVVRWQRQLSGFAKVRLQPGESAIAETTFTAEVLAVWLDQTEARPGKWWIEPGDYSLHACSTVADCRLSTPFRIEGGAGLR